jgi:methylated-DNA-protein-cysteine methyltransferase-like protein
MGGTALAALAVYVRTMKQKYKSAGLGKPSKSFAEIWDVVAVIPRGKVTTYGDIARLCGLPGQARLVGYALHNLPEKLKIPWHRVINSQGKISFPPSSRYNNIQRKLLQKEGIKFIGNRVLLQNYRWLRDSV